MQELLSPTIQEERLNHPSHVTQPQIPSFQRSLLLRRKGKESLVRSSCLTSYIGHLHPPASCPTSCLGYPSYVKQSRHPLCMGPTRTASRRLAPGCHPELMAKDLCPTSRCHGSARSFGGRYPEPLRLRSGQACRMGQDDNCSDIQPYS